MLAALLEDGDLLDKAVGGENGVQCIHSHRVHHVLHLRHNLIRTSPKPHATSDFTALGIALGRLLRLFGPFPLHCCLLGG